MNWMRSIIASIAMALMASMAGCYPMPNAPSLLAATDCFIECEAAAPGSSAAAGNAQSLRTVAAEHPEMMDVVGSAAGWHDPSPFSPAQILDARWKCAVQYRGKNYDVYRIDGPASHLLLSYEQVNHEAAAVLQVNLKTQVAGSADAVAVLLAVFAVEGVYDLPPADATKPILPIPYPAKKEAVARLVGMDGLLTIESITPHHDESRHGEQQEKVWYSVDVSRTECFQTPGPASRIEDIRADGLLPKTRDIPGSNGALSIVEVIEDDGVNEHIWRYYRSMPECVAAEIQSTKDLADRYR